jgi:hypothetical protein
MEVIEPSCTPRPSSRKRFATLVTALVATTTLSLPAATALSATVHAADRGMTTHSGSRYGGGGITDYSHRLALGSVRPESLRLT